MVPSFDAPDPIFRKCRAMEVWLDSDGSTDRERIDRLGGDRELYAAIRTTGFEGEDWLFVVQELARYGLHVMTKWVREGTITIKCHQKKVKGVPILHDWVRADWNLVEDIAAETVEEAIEHYRDDVLAKNVWDPDKGASLRTFFIGQCMFRYVVVYPRLTRIPERHRYKHSELSALDDLGVGSVEDDVIRSATVQYILDGASSERAARALAMDAHGYPQQTIAVDLGVSVDSVKGMLKRERARVRQDPAVNGKDTA